MAGECRQKQAENRELAYKMYLEGKDINEIANHIGYTVQTVRNIINDRERDQRPVRIEEQHIKSKDVRKREIVMIGTKRYIDEVDFIAGR